MVDRQPDELDPELERQLVHAVKSGAPVEFVIKLRHSGPLPDPDDIQAKTDRAVKRAADATGETPRDVHVMGRIGVAYVSASAAFARELIAAPEVSSAMANDRDGS